MASIITAQDVVDRLGRGSDSDPGLAIAIGVATDIVRTFTEQTITAAVNETVVLDGTGGESLLLPELPVTRVRSVTVTADGVDEDLVEDTDWVLNDNGILFRVDDGIWTTGRQNITVVYDHGWADGSIPRDLTGVALEIAIRLHVQGPAVEESLGQARVKYAGAAMELTATEKRILSKYRQVR